MGDLRRLPKLVRPITWATLGVTEEQARLIDERIDYVRAATLHERQGALESMLRSAYFQGLMDGAQLEEALAESESARG